MTIKVSAAVAREIHRARRLAAWRLDDLKVKDFVIEQMAGEMHLGLDIVNDLNNSSLLITSKNYYRRKPQKVRDAEAAGLPIYVLKSNTPPQIRQLLQHVSPVAVSVRQDDIKLALGEAEEAVEMVKSGEDSVELSPRSAYIRRLQHLIVQRNSLSSQSVGRDPIRRVRIYKAG